MRAGFLALFIASAAFGANPPRLTFTRTVPAPKNLGLTNDLVVLYAIGDSDRISTFLDEFVEHVNRSGRLRMTNAVDSGHHFIGAHPDEATVRAVQHDHPADAYLGVNLFTCRSEQKG